MLETLLNKNSTWLSGKGPDADVAVYSQCRLVRNLADFPYPNQCTSEEKQAIVDRVVATLDSLNLLSEGKYYSLEELDNREARFLMERRLIAPNLLEAEGPRGVYVTEDQSFSIAVNDENHLTILGLASGLQLPEVWSRINLVDDTLAGILDFSFDTRIGYLTTAVGDVGTGLKCGLVMHLPALSMNGEWPAVEHYISEKRHTLQPLYGRKGEPLGDLFLLVNTSTLGRSEEETLFHVKHIASDIIKRERAARKTILNEVPLQLEDRVGRALGLARHARLLAFAEALSVLSSLRLGVSEGLVSQFSLHVLNDLLISSQNAHIETKRGHDCDELTLSTERADLFRSRFA